jgi:hypothetical protein
VTVAERYKLSPQRGRYYRNLADVMLLAKKNEPRFRRFTTDPVCRRLVELTILDVQFDLPLS